MKKFKIFTSSFAVFLGASFLTIGLVNVNTAKEAKADNGLEIVSVAGQSIPAEKPEEQWHDASLPAGKVGDYYNVTLVAEGGSGQYVWSVDLSSFPNGVTLNPNTGVISGTPLVTSQGDIVIRVTDKNDEEIHDIVYLGMFFYEESDAPHIVEPEPTNGTVGAHYYLCLEYQGSSILQPKWEVSKGSLPPGLELSKSGPLDADLSGEPTEAGTYNFSIKCSTMLGFDEIDLTVIVDEPFNLTYAAGNYYLGDTVQINASCGNDKVTWDIIANSSNTTINDEGLVTIGIDEDISDIIVYAYSKVNPNFERNIYFDYIKSLAYSITVIDGVALDNFSEPTSKQGAGDYVSIEPLDFDDRIFDHWSIEAGSTPVELLWGTDAANNIFYMPAGNVIIKANYVTIINSLSATFDKPVNGQHPDTTISTGSSNYSARLAYVDGQSENFDSITFETDKYYRFDIEFIPNDGYTFPSLNEMSVTINGEELDMDSYSSSYTWHVIYKAVSDEIPQYSIFVTSGIADCGTAEEGATVKITAEEAPEGFVFDKWVSPDVSFANEHSPVTTFVMPANEVNISAQYKEIKQYNITFDANGGSAEMTPLKVNEGSKFVLPESLFVPPMNKQFKCWSVNGTEKNVGEEIQVNNDLNIKAIYEDIKVTVTFIANNGTDRTSEQEVVKGTIFTLPNCTFEAPSNHYFSSWQVDGKNYNPGNTVVISDDTEVTAIWNERVEPSVDPSVEPSVDPSIGPEPTPSGESGGGLGGGAIAGIVIGAVLGVAIVGFAVYWFAIKKKTFKDLANVFKDTFNKIFKKNK